MSTPSAGDQRAHRSVASMTGAEECPSIADRFRVCLFGAVGQNPEVPNADEPVGDDVKQKRRRNSATSSSMTLTVLPWQ